MSEPITSERVVFTEEVRPYQYVTLSVSGELDSELLDALTSFVKRQRTRIAIARTNAAFEEEETS